MQIESRVQKWGNGLSLRISGVLRTVPNLKEGDLLTINVDENGFSATKIKKKTWTEEELLLGMDANNAHADLAPDLLSIEYE
ncbi:MAG: transcriptional regulator [Gammaproteobacteria bacterium]